MSQRSASASGAGIVSPSPCRLIMARKKSSISFLVENLGTDIAFALGKTGRSERAAPAVLSRSHRSKWYGVVQMLADRPRSVSRGVGILSLERKRQIFFAVFRLAPPRTDVVF